MEAMLDEKHPPLKGHDGDDNEFTMGSIGVHNVVISCLPAGKTGNNSAAIVAKDMLRSFPIKFGLMVGVGGGVWSKKFDIRLGDVVVCQPDGIHGGVVQWDFAKEEIDGVFRRTGSLNSPPRLLLNALQTIQNQHMIEGNNLQWHLSEMLKKKPKMAERFIHVATTTTTFYKVCMFEVNVGAQI